MLNYWNKCNNLFKTLTKINDILEYDVYFRIYLHFVHLNLKMFIILLRNLSWFKTKKVESEPNIVHLCNSIDLKMLFSWNAWCIGHLNVCFLL